MRSIAGARVGYAGAREQGWLRAALQRSQGGKRLEAARLEAARVAYGSLIPVLWEHVARAQALAKALSAFVSFGLRDMAIVTELKHIHLMDIGVLFTDMYLRSSSSFHLFSLS